MLFLIECLVNTQINDNIISLHDVTRFNEVSFSLKEFELLLSIINKEI